jgi:tRNA G18 (ribose-2'-O)-methylase SpoU
MGMDGILFTGGCSDPLYRRAIRVSMGSIFQIPWTVVDSAAELFSILQASGFVTAALSLRDDSIRIDHPIIKEAMALALYLGNEGSGLPAERIASCDYSVKIPMFHGVDSLNVAAASAVAFWECRK